MKNYIVEKNDPLVLNCTSPLDGMYKLSPFVWKEKKKYHMLVRAVNTSEDAPQKVARVYYGISDDGLEFKMGDGAVIAPGTNPLDKDGCEDPTLVYHNHEYLVYYTGWNQTILQGQLLLARGKKISELKLDGIKVKSKEPYINPKEATLAQMKDKSWVLLFEYANENRSKLGKGVSAHPAGPWKLRGEFVPAVKGSWDSYHLSPGPVITDQKNDTMLFYNGSDENARWRIGWAELDADGNITRRCSEPLITPPKNKPGETDIAFASSAITVGNDIWLYYTTADKTTYRAVIRVL